MVINKGTKFNIIRARAHIQSIKKKQVALNVKFEHNKTSLEEYQRKWLALSKEIAGYQAVTLVLGNKDSYNFYGDVITRGQAKRLVKRKK